MLITLDQLVSEFKQAFVTHSIYDFATNTKSIIQIMSELSYPIYFSTNGFHPWIVSSSGLSKEEMHGIWLDFNRMKPIRYGLESIQEKAIVPGQNADDVFGPVEAPKHMTLVNSLGFAARIQFFEMLSVIPPAPAAPPAPTVQLFGSALDVPLIGSSTGQLN